MVTGYVNLHHIWSVKTKNINTRELLYPANDYRRIYTVKSMFTGLNRHFARGLTLEFQKKWKKKTGKLSSVTRVFNT